MKVMKDRLQQFVYDDIQLHPFADECMDMLYDDECQFELEV